MYIGVHKTKNINDDYLGSGFLLTLAIKKYGKSNFTKKVLKVFNGKIAAYSYEKNLVNQQFVDLKTTYNLKIGGLGGFIPLYGDNHPGYGKHRSLKTKEKISKALLGPKNPWYGKKGSLHPNFGKKHSQEAKDKIAAFNSGKILSKETKNKISLASSGVNNYKAQKVYLISRLGRIGYNCIKDLAIEANIPYPTCKYIFRKCKVDQAYISPKHKIRIERFIVKDK
ncbi:MAG: NUMOD3 domain-containing DNA-binding protein [Candidatus Izemoplasma sp.]